MINARVELTRVGPVRLPSNEVLTEDPGPREDVEELFLSRGIPIEEPEKYAKLSICMHDRPLPVPGLNFAPKRFKINRRVPYRVGQNAFQVALVPLCFNFIDIKGTNGSATLNWDRGVSYLRNQRAQNQKTMRSREGPPVRLAEKPY